MNVKIKLDRFGWWVCPSAWVCQIIAEHGPSNLCPADKTVLDLMLAGF